MEKAKLIKKETAQGFDRIEFKDKKYMLEEIVGGTNASKVYKAHDESDPENKLALKIIFLNADSTLDDLSTLNSITERVGTYSNINHPNIAKLENFFYLDSALSEVPVIVREFIEGESLQKKLDNGKIYSSEEATELLEDLLEIADYLETATTQEIVVRDVKPGNIIITNDGETKLTDLELCTSSGQATTGGRGTLAYMPQEQLFDAHPTAMWDRYAIAKTLEHVITGKIPEHNKQVEFNNGIRVPRYLQKILKKMTAKETGERYASAKEIFRELEQIRERTGENCLVSRQSGPVNYALVPTDQVKTALTLLPREINLIQTQEQRTDFPDNEDEREIIRDFCSFAAQLEEDDPQAPLTYNLAKAVRLVLEAKQGITKKEELNETINPLIKLSNYDVYEKSDKRIVLVDSSCPNIKVLQIYGPNDLYLDELKGGISVDDFIADHKLYRIGILDPAAKKKYDHNMWEANEGIQLMLGLGTMIGLGISAIVGIACESFGAFGIGAGITVGADCVAVGTYFRYKSKQDKKYQQAMDKAEDPRLSFSYHLPSTMIKAFLPEFSGEE